MLDFDKNVQSRKFMKSMPEVISGPCQVFKIDIFS